MKMNNGKKRIAIFASGTGSNAKKIIEYFSGHAVIETVLVLCNKPGAGVITIAKENDIPLLMIEKEKFFHGNAYVDELKNTGIDFIILAGFLWKVPPKLISAFANRIINIHPALLPKYGGKGMYGAHVHEAVLAAGDSESGITIHLVDEYYDHGKNIFQTRCPVMKTDTVATLAARIHGLEHEFFSKQIEQYIHSFKN